MPVLTTRVASDRRVDGGRVVLEHVLDDGSIERENVEFVPAAKGLTALAAGKRANYDRFLADREINAAVAAIGGGIDPAALVARHATRKQLLAAVFTGFLEAEPSSLDLAAVWLRDNHTDPDLDAAVGAARRAKLRARQARILRMAPDLAEDRIALEAERG